MPIPALAPAGQKAIARFGGRALPGTGALQSFIDLNDLGAWLLRDYQISDSMRQIGAEQARWRGKGYYLSDDFGRGIGRTVTLATEYYEGTNLGGSGNPIAQQLGLLSQAGEQYLTFDNKTYLLAKYKGNSGRRLKYPSPPYWWALGLEFVCREPWARDFQPSGSLSNLLNPNGGFESAAVQPTLYGSTVVQSNDFETAPATVDYFHSIGTEALGTLAAWTQGNGAWSIAANVVSAPTSTVDANMSAGHADTGDCTWTVRTKWVTGANCRAGVHLSASGGFNYIFAELNSTGVILFKVVGNIVTNVGSMAFAPTTGTWYWLQVQASGATYTAKLFADSTGAISAQQGTTVTATIADAVLQNGQFALGTSNGAGQAQFGGAFANVCYATGPAPTGWTTNARTSWGAAGEPAFCWSKKQAYYGGASLSITVPAASTTVSEWVGPVFAQSGAAQWSVAVNVTSQTGLANSRLEDWQRAVPVQVGTTTGWTVMGASYNYSNPQISLNRYGSGTGTTYFDYAAVVQPTTPTGVLFNSLGQALGGFTPTGTLAAWTNLAGTSAIAANKVTSSAFVGNEALMLAGHADSWDGTAFMRLDSWQPGVGLGVRVSATGAGYFAILAGDLRIYTRTAGGGYASLVASVGLTLNAGSAYWLRFTASGTTLTAYVYKDAGGYVGDQVTTVTITDSTYSVGQAAFRNYNGPPSSTFGGNYPGTFLVQGPLPTGVTLADAAGEPAFCWSKNAPHSGTYAMSVYNNDAGATGDVLESFTAAAASYAAAAFLKATGAGTASLSLAGAGSQSVTQDNTWRQSAAAVAALSAGASSVRMRMAGAGTAYFDDVVLQQGIDSQAGLYAQAFIDQVALGGSAGAGTTTTFTLTYAGSVWAEPLWRITLPSTKGAAISSVTLVNQTTGVGLTFNFATPLPAGSSQTLDIDCSALTAVIGTAQYDWSAPIGGGKTGFPVLFPGANTIAVTIVTNSGTATGCTLDTSFTNRWEM